MARRVSRERAELIIRQFHRYDEYFAERGVSRRDFLRMIAAGSAASTVLPVLVACGAASDDDAAEATATATSGAGGQPDQSTQSPTSSGSSTQATGGSPKQGGTILIGTLGEAQSINPLTGAAAEGTWRSRMLFGQLVEHDLETLEPRPSIAQDWSVSDDGLEYTITLQGNATFGDETPLTAADVEFTLLGLLTKDVASIYVNDFLTIEGAQEYYDGNADSVSGITVVDDKTIKLKLVKPNAPFITTLRNVRPVPKHLLEGKNLRTDPFFQKPVGAGPFKVTSWKVGQDFVAERNPTYWEDGKPYLDGFTHRTIADSQTLVIALETGEIESSEYALPQRAEQLKQVENLAVLTVPPGKDINGWGMGQNQNEILQDARVRRAITMAIDTETYVNDFLLGLGRPANGPVPVNHWAYNKDMKPIPFDPEGAKQLIQEAGAEGATLTGTVNAGNHMREDWLTFTQQALSAIGLTVEPNLKEWTQVVSSGQEGMFDLICPTFSSITYDPDELYETLHSESPRNVYGYSNSDVDKLFEQGRVTLDREERKTVYGELQALLLEDVPAYWAWDRPFINVVTKAFQGYENTILPFYADLENWWKTE